MVASIHLLASLARAFFERAPLIVRASAGHRHLVEAFLIRFSPGFWNYLLLLLLLLRSSLLLLLFLLFSLFSGFFAGGYSVSLE